MAFCPHCMKTAEINVGLIDSCGTDLSVVNAARVSFHKESEEFEAKDTKLVTYLAQHKHFSPFNHAFASFRVKAPLFVARQLVKHKFLPWNEVSRRYVQDEPEFYIPSVWRKAAENVKQGSSGEAADITPIEQMCGDSGNLFLPEEAVRVCLQTYQALLKVGVCAEQARMVLPQNMMTEWIWSGTLGAWADMCRLRLDPHTQAESREVAENIAAEMRVLFPVSFDALLKA